MNVIYLSHESLYDMRWKFEILLCLPGERSVLDSGGHVICLVLVTD